MEHDDATKDQLVVGIDFGTTFSGVAAAYSASPDSPDQINVIKTWPGGNNATSDKVPSEITYAPASNPIATPPKSAKRKASHISTDKPFDDPLSFAASRPASASAMQGNASRWGFQVRPDDQRLRCLKLLLDPGQALPNYVSFDDIAQQLLASGKTVDVVVADYLKAIFGHTKEVLERRYGKFFVSITQLQVVLTVPAVWSDTAQNATLKAAKAAGIGDNITMISEPEAAAVYALQAIQPNRLKIGENFVVVDAGGGTVDLITYSIRQLSPLRFEEVVRGSGGMCGAAFLNIRFEQFCRDNIGRREFDRIRLGRPKTWLMALKYFEDYVKRDFNPTEQNTYNVPFPGVSDITEAGLDEGFLVMTTFDVAELFRPVLVDIMNLVDGQIKEVQSLGKEVNALLLVGGFGQSECLLQCLRNRFSAFEPPIHVMQPNNAWTAVVRGAVLRGLEGSDLVLNRKARRHYGVSAAPLYQPSVHSYSNKYWDEFEECWRARNQMTWYIRQGETVSATEPVIFPFHRKFTSDQDKTVTDELILCHTNDAPKEFSSAAGSSTKVICKLVTNLSTVPKHLWKSKKNSKGRRYQELHYELGMQIESGGLRFDLRVDDVVYGKVTTSFA